MSQRFHLFRVFRGPSNCLPSTSATSMQLHGKTALTTGRTPGSAAATAPAFAAQGADFVISARHHDDDAQRTKLAVEQRSRRCEIILAGCASAADCTRLVADTVRALGRL